MRIKNSDAEDFKLDATSIVQRYEDPAVDFSLDLLDVDGTHEVTSEEDIAYFVLDGEGHIHLGNKIIELDQEDVVFAKQPHEIEGDLMLLAIRDREGETVLWSPVKD